MKTVINFIIAVATSIIALLNTSCEKNDVVLTDNSAYQQTKLQEPYTAPIEVDDEVPGEFLEQ